MPGINTSAGPEPCSTTFTKSPSHQVTIYSIPQRLPCLQSVLNPFERFSLAAELEERFAFEVEQILLANRCRVRQGAAGHHECEGSADDRIMIADPAGPPGEVDSKLQRSEHSVAANRDRHP